MLETTAYTQLIAHLRPLGRRWRWRAGVQAAHRTIGIALGVAALALIAGRVFPFAEYRLVAGGVIAGWLLALTTYHLVRRVPPFLVAQHADRELALQDRLATALVLADPRSHARASFDTALVARQIADALTVAAEIDPRHAFRWRLRRALILGDLIALAIVGALVVLPNPMDALVAERARIAETAQAQAAKLELLAREIEQNPTLAPAERAALVRQIRDLIARLAGNPGDAKKALADLAQFQDQWRAQLDPAAPTEQAALDALARQLAQLAGAPDKSPDATQAAQLLEQLAAQLEQMTPAQRAQFADALDRAATQVAARDPDLAAALAQMAQAARGEQASAAQTQRATRQAAQALRAAATDQAFQAALARALSQTEASQRAVASASNSAAMPAGNSVPGANSSTAATQVGVGGGTAANTLPPAVRAGVAGAPANPNKAFGVSDLETVYAPVTAGQGRGEIVGGQQNQTGTTTSYEGKAPLPGATHSALVPYSQVYLRYAEIAGQTLERAYVPAGLQDLVKEYFSALEP